MMQPDTNTASATEPIGAEQKGGDNENRSDAGQTPRTETHDELCDRYAKVSEFEWMQFCQDEIRRLYPRPMSKASLDKMRKEGQQTAKKRAEATAASDSEPQPRRLSDAGMESVIKECETIADLKGLALNVRIDEIAKQWGLSAPAIRSEIKSILDKRAEETGASSGGNEVRFDDPEPCEIPVDGRMLLDEIAAAIRDNMDLPPHVAELCALWIAHTYCYKLFSHSIRLAIMSPQPRCGKTRLQDLIGLMAWRPKQSANMSGAVMYRLVAHYGVTLIIDEVDTHLAGPTANPEIRGILNAGHGRNGCVDRCEGDDHKVVSFPCFGPVVLGGIGTLPPTLQDRSASIWLQRKSREKKLPRIDDRAENWLRIKRQCLRWINDSYDALARAEPSIPGDLTDRQADGWRALLAIADVAGGDWPAKAKAAAIAISGAEPEAETIGVQLLTDIFAMFHKNTAEDDEPPVWEVIETTDKHGDTVPAPLTSKAIVAGLLALETRPWAEWNKGKGITMNALGRQLDHFHIRSKQLKGKPGIDPGTNPHGYEYEQFSEIWPKYLDTNRYSATTRRNPPKTRNVKPLPESGGSGFDFAGNPQKSATCSGVAVSQGGFEPDDGGLPEQRPGAEPAAYGGAL
jgi:putative DNA primase/helicase